jgi:hypothetical protein
MKMAPVPGVQTFVNEKSQRGLPTDTDREKEQVLPLPGSATPGGAGRDIPRFELNRPDNGIDKRPRTLPQPGEDYGHPTKYDYNMPTRRTMTGAQRLVARYLVARGFSPPKERGGEGGRPQRQQMLDERLDDRRDYRSQAPRKRMESKKYYHQVCKKNPKCMRRREEYRENPDYYKRRAPRPKASAGYTFVFDQESPDPEVKQPEEGVDYRAEGPTTYSKDPAGDSGMPPGNAGFHDTQDRDSMNPSSGKVIPSQMKQDLYEQLTYPRAASRTAAATIAEIFSNCDPGLVERSKGIEFRRKRISPSGLSTWEAQGSKGETYTVRVKPLPKKKIQVSCSCDFFRWQGPEHWAQANEYLYGKPRGTAAQPEVKDPKGKHWACKHVLAVLEVARGWKTASLEPLPSAKRVAARYALLSSR